MTPVQDLPARLARVVSGRPTPLVALALLSWVPATAQSLPPPPKLPLDTYEAPARAQIAQAQQAVEQMPRDAERNGRLGMLLYANEQYEFAEPCFARAHALAPTEARWPYYLGRAQSNLAAHERAATSLRSALRLRPEYLPARLQLAKSLFEARQADESRTLYEAIVRDHPEAAEAHYGLGSLAAAAGDARSAVDQLRKACALSPGFGAAHFALARAYRDAGEKEKSQQQLDLYQKDRLGWPPVPDPLLAEVLDLKTGALARLDRAIQLAEAGELQPAAAEHEAALAADPTLVQAHVNLIRLYGTLGQPQQAEAHYRAALALNPALAEVHYNYGVLLVGQKKPEEAAEAFRRALELNPAYSEANYNYASLLMSSGKLDEAATYFRAALAGKPDHRQAHFNLARVLVWRERYAEAIEELRQTLAPEDAETPRCTYALGAAYARAGDAAEALRYLTQAREKALALGQSDLVASIDKDLRALARLPVSPP